MGSGDKPGVISRGTRGNAVPIIKKPPGRMGTLLLWDKEWNFCWSEWSSFHTHYTTCVV